MRHIEDSGTQFFQDFASHTVKFNFHNFSYLNTSKAVIIEKVYTFGPNSLTAKH